MLIAVTGSALAVVATILLIPVTALQIAQEPLNAIFRPALWQPLMIDAHVAVLLVITAGLASALLTQANFSSGGSGNTLWLRVLVSLLALAALIGPILTGHTQSMKPAWLMQVSDFIHLAAGAFWLGGVICLGVFMRHAQSMSHAVLAGVVSRFSSLASVSVLALTVSGVVMAAIISDSWASLTATDFGTTLGAKLLLVTAVLVFAVWNKFRLVPALNSTTPLAGAQGASLSKPNNTELLFRRTIMWEAVLLLAVGLVSGILTHTNPHSATPPPAASMEFTQEPATSPTVPARDPNESSPISTPQAPVEMMVEEGGLHVHGYLDLGTTGVNTYKYEIFTGGAFSIYENVEFEIFAPGTAPDDTANPVTRVVPRVDGETEYSYADFNFTEPGDWRVDVLVPITTERITRLSMWARIPPS
jgi:copper transport protein